MLLIFRMEALVIFSPFTHIFPAFLFSSLFRLGKADENVSLE